jgi:DNA-binding CsgD family transcriptional regulator
MSATHVSRRHHSAAFAPMAARATLRPAGTMTTTGSDDDLREELARVLDGGVPEGFVRDEVVVSWHASSAAGLRPDLFAPSFDARFRPPAGLLCAARPVIARLGADLRGTEICVVLADARERVVCRQPSGGASEDFFNDLCLAPGYSWRVESVGTNALGLAGALDAPVLIVGGEHFMDALTGASTAAAPVHDLRTERLVGVVALVSAAATGDSLLLPVARRAAADIAQRVARHPTPLGWTSLTDAERALSGLVGLGLTNREAAARLYVSRHTVDAHLRHIFRKLDITSRVQLAHVVATQTADPAVPRQRREQ